MPRGSRPSDAGRSRYQLARGAARVQVFIAALNDGVIEIDANPSDSVSDLKIKVQSKVGTLPGELRLMYAGKQMQDDRMLAD